MHEQTPMAVALTIAGSDSGGGAGIQADLKTFHAFGVFGTSAITAITVQNTRGVSGVHAIPLETVRAQIDAVADDLPPAACKTGMLATRELVHTVAAAIRERRLPNFVLDPVMVATSGDRLLDEDAQHAVLDELLPLASLVTPNLDEASILVGFVVRDEDAMHRAARRLVEAGAGAALIKGGHLRSDDLVDVLHDGRLFASSGVRAFTRAARTAQAARFRPPSLRSSHAASRSSRRSSRPWTTCIALLRRRRVSGLGMVR
jgi:hydroxymethylpyrimidine/phosphomethylpyrimidine kinase